MTLPRLSHRDTPWHPVLRRFAALALLDGAAEEALSAALQKSRTMPPRHELLIEGQEIGEPLILVDGWAARTRMLEDGRRQIMNFTLPGDMIGLCDQVDPIASSTMIALTRITVCPAPDSRLSPALRAAYAMSRALEEGHLLGQITRLGRLSAHERIEDLFLELLERLDLAGLAEGGGFAIPLTQEQLADAVGLTPVHVNRMLQQARQAGALTWRAGILTLRDPRAVRRKVGRRKIRVSAPWPIRRVDAAGSRPTPQDSR
jgi:CRP-like cAMP-binding protein